jgi:hypothetical protein
MEAFFSFLGMGIQKDKKGPVSNVNDYVAFGYLN